MLVVSMAEKSSGIPDSQKTYGSTTAQVTGITGWVDRETYGLVGETYGLVTGFIGKPMDSHWKVDVYYGKLRHTCLVA